VAIADVYDSLTHERPYKRAWSKEEAVTEIKAGTGSHFDPDVVGAFMEIVDLLPLGADGWALVPGPRGPGRPCLHRWSERSRRPRPLR